MSLRRLRLAILFAAMPSGLAAAEGAQVCLLTAPGIEAARERGALRADLAPREAALQQLRSTSFYADLNAAEAGRKARDAQPALQTPSDSRS